MSTELFCALLIFLFRLSWGWFKLSRSIPVHYVIIYFWIRWIMNMISVYSESAHNLNDLTLSGADPRPFLRNKQTMLSTVCCLSSIALHTRSTTGEFSHSRKPDSLTLVRISSWHDLLCWTMDIFHAKTRRNIQSSRGGLWKKSSCDHKQIPFFPIFLAKETRPNTILRDWSAFAWLGFDARKFYVSLKLVSSSRYGI